MTPSESQYREIPLTRGQVAIVDAADYEWLNRWKWYAAYSQSSGSFYATRKDTGPEENRRILMHRLILGLAGDDPRQGDHIEVARTLDNRRTNLRIATRSQQQHNKRRARNNTTGFKGVCVDKQHGFRAQILVNGKRKLLGVGHDPVALHEKYKIAARELRGEFARAY